MDEDNVNCHGVVELAGRRMDVAVDLVAKDAVYLVAKDAVYLV